MGNIGISNNIKFYHFTKILRTYSYINSHSDLDKENTSDHVILSIKEINEKMYEAINQKLDRRTIYKYIEDLKQLGFEVSTFEDNEIGYALVTKIIETYELRLLVDSISSNKFITKKKTKELVDKLCSLNNIYIGYSLHKQAFIDDRLKSSNEEILYSIDSIDDAINRGKKISFNYYDYNYKKELVFRTEKNTDNIKTYVTTPVGLILKEDYYYVIVNHDKHDELTNYRVTRMKNVKVLDEDAKPLEEINGCEEGYFNVAIYAKQNFKMSSGEDGEICLQIKPCLINLIIDELGEDVEIYKLDEDTYQVNFNAKMGIGLTKWIMQLGADAKVIAPEKLRDDVKENIEKMMEIYK